MVGWKLEWSAPDFPVRVDSRSVSTPVGESQTHYRVSVGEASFAGAVAVPIASDTGRVLLVRQERIRVGRELWELPRGMAEVSDTDPVATALRELHEETGISAKAGEFLGMVFPDSGFLASEVAVVLVEVAGEDVARDACDGEVQAQDWFSRGQLGEMIREGELRDSISLSALAVVAQRA
ncbi:NUDIX hydrolase [Actinomyces urinae]|uniref:NUDIX hydrolase n=1 Tax=Actinomyces urinae TaxID=1689268 RepID=UPI000930FD48|nr:NUDIX hydrolase [Actinomyces urinae]